VKVYALLVPVQVSQKKATFYFQNTQEI